MEILTNHHRGTGPLAPNAPFPSTNVAAVRTLLERCPAAQATPLQQVDDLINGVTVFVKDERGRMGLGSFKALGAAYVIAHDAAEAADAPDGTTLQGRCYITASAGNHGMSVAAGARVFGAKAVVYIAQTVPESFAARLSAQGAEVRRAGRDYAASMAAAAAAAEAGKGTLLSDSSWDGYTTLPHRLMEGYLAMAAEAAEAMPNAPTHIFLQAGVGGLAGAVAAYARHVWGDTPKIIVVEPTAAPALQASIRAGKCVFADGPDSSMGRLDCKEPSLIALNGLARDADVFVTLDDAEVEAQLPQLAAKGLATTPSGGAGLAAAMIADVRNAVGIGPGARILTFISELPE